VTSNVRKKLRMKRYLNVGVDGCASWPSKETSISFGGHELILKPATKDSEQSVHIDLKGLSNVEALTLINRFLSILSWCDNQGMENLYGWSGNPVPVPVPKRSRFLGSSIAFPFYRDQEEEPKAKLALALYREGLTVNSVPFQFLSFFKILNIFWIDKFKNGENEIIEGIRKYLEKIIDSTGTKRIEKIKQLEPDVAKYLYESGRCAIAHAYSEPIVYPDDVQHLRRLSEDINIIKSIAEKLIVTKLNISRTIY